MKKQRSVNKGDKDRSGSPRLVLLGALRQETEKFRKRLRKKKMLRMFRRIIMKGKIRMKRMKRRI